MIYKAVDRWNSPYIEHHGVKGMKWGVRKAAEQVGKTIRGIGSAVKKTAGKIVGGAVKVGSAVRRFKNRRAIRSGDVQRILKRSSKMSIAELQEASDRTKVLSNIYGNRLNKDGNDSNPVKKAIEKQVDNAVANVVSSAVTSAITRESFTDSIIKAYGGKTEAEKEKEVRDQNSSDLKQKVQDLKNQQYLDAQVSSIKTKMLLPTGKTAVNRGLNKKNRRLNKKLSDSTRYKWEPKINVYDNRVYQSDINELDDNLAHYGIPGMKWGVRKDVRSAYDILRYRDKIEKNKNRYTNLQNKRSKMKLKSAKMGVKANSINNKIRRIREGKLVPGLWVNDKKKINSLANESRKTLTKKDKYDFKAAKLETKANKSLGKIKKYNNKIQKLSKNIQNLDVSSLHLSEADEKYIKKFISQNGVAKTPISSINKSSGRYDELDKRIGRINPNYVI